MISVIIPSYCSQSTIIECIQSLVNQKIEEHFEILVVNSSADDTEEMVKEHFPNVEFVQLEQRVFAGTARNIGIQKARGDILAFTDSDCTASPSWLRKIVSWHLKGYRAVCGSIHNASNENIFSKAEYSLEIIEFSPKNPLREVDFVSGANCSFSREVFDKCGLFPDTHRGQDLLFSHMVAQKGEKIIFDPEIKVFHKNDIGLNGYIKKQIKHGEYSYKSRQIARLPGSFMNNPILLPFMLPLFPLLRALRVIYRSFTLSSRLTSDILYTFPIFFLGCAMWSFGYAKAYFSYILNRLVSS